MGLPGSARGKVFWRRILDRLKLTGTRRHGQNHQRGQGNGDSKNDWNRGRRVAKWMF
jgi:hypothetical protein